MMQVCLEKEDGNSRRKSMLFGGVLAGAIALFCALALAAKFGKSESRI